MTLAALPRRRLRAMRAAGEEILDCYEALARGNTNLLLDFMRGMGTFTANTPYPAESVVDRASLVSFYYHSHREGEHGHFHTYFLNGPDAPATPHQPYAHVIALKIDDTGIPLTLFTTNRWVTGETLRPARELIAMLDRFEIDHAWPSWLVNRWMTAMVRLFRPQVEKLLVARDAALTRRARSEPEPTENREVEVLSEVTISIDRQIAAVDRALDREKA